MRRARRQWIAYAGRASRTCLIANVSGAYVRRTTAAGGPTRIGCDTPRSCQGRLQPPDLPPALVRTGRKPDLPWSNSCPGPDSNRICPISERLPRQRFLNRVSEVRFLRRVFACRLLMLVAEFPRSPEALSEPRLRACPVAFVGDRPAEPQLGIPRTAEARRSWPSRSLETSGRTLLGRSACHPRSLGATRESSSPCE